MKNLLNIHRLPYLILGSGCLGAALRLWMYATAVDEKGLLITGNIQHTLALILSAAVVAATVAAVWKLDGSNRFAANFPPSRTGGLSALLAAIGIVSVMLDMDFAMMDTLDLIWLVLSILSLPCLAVTGLCRLQGKRPPFYLHGLICVFFCIHLANEYRVWSGNPQIADCIFQLFACVGLALAAYYRTAFDVGMGRRRLQLGVNLLTAYFCFVSVTEPGFSLFYAGCGLWCLTNLCALDPPPRRRREVQPE